MTSKETPSTTTKDKSKGIPDSIVIRGKDCNIIPPEHGDQVDRRNDPMPQAIPEPIGLSFEAFSDNFLIGTT